jgi:hypothetical protein
MFPAPTNPLSLKPISSHPLFNSSKPATLSPQVQAVYNVAIDRIVDPGCPKQLRTFLVRTLSTHAGELYIWDKIPQKALGTKRTFLWGAIVHITETALGKVIRSVRDIFTGNTNEVLSRSLTPQDLRSAELQVRNSEWGEFCLNGVLAGAALSLLAQDSTPLLAGIALSCGPSPVRGKLVPDYTSPLGSYSISANLSNIFGQNYTGNVFQSKGGNPPTSYLFGPQYIGSVAAPGPVATVTANGSTIYGAFGSAGSGQINYQNPYLPQVSQLIANVQSDRLLSPYGSYLAIARGNLGAYLFNCQPSCTLVSSFNTAGICVAAFVTEVAGIGIVFHIGDSAAGYSTVSMYPAAPALLSNYNSPGSAVHLAFIGTTTIIADTSSVIAVDASNVSALSLLFTFPVAGGTVSCVTIHNGNVFATAGPQGLLSLGFSTTSGFKLLGRYDNIGWAQWITFREGTDVAFLTDATTSAGFHVIATTPPELMRSIAISTLPGLPQGIANIGDYTITADGSSNNLALTTKLHDQKVPTCSGTSSLTQRGKYDVRIEASDGYTPQTAQFTVTFSTEVKVKNTPAPISISLNTRGTTLFDPKQLFYFSGSVGILNLAFSDPRTSSFSFQPNIASGSYDTGSSILSLATSGTVVISLGAGQIRYLDATTQTLLTPLRILTTGGSTRKVAVTASKLAVIADGFLGVRIDKFTTPTSATTVGTWSQIPGFARDVTLIGSVAFFIYDALGVAAFQIADSTAPYLLSIFNTTATPQAIGTDGQLIYTTTLQGLEIVNYHKNVSQPERLAYLPLSNNPDTISINNGKAYLTTGLAQVAIIDLANCTNPFVQYVVNTQARAISTAIYENLLFVSMASLGVEVFNIKNAPSSILLIPTTYGAGPIIFLNGQPLISDGTNIKSLDLSQLTYTLDVTANLTNAGTYVGILTCTDDLGNPITSSVSLRTEGGPVATGPLPPVTAFVGQAFSWVVPGIVQDPNKDVVSYTIGSIPWAVSSSTGVVQGTPSLADVGMRNVSITVSDGHNGELTLFLPLTVKVPPYGAKQIASQLVDINTPSVIKIDPTAITSPSGDPLQYSLTLSNGQPLPPEITFNPATLELTVFTTVEKSYELALSGKTADGGSATLTFKITASSYPKFQTIITPPIVPRGAGLTYQLPDSKQLISSMHPPLAFQLEVSDNTGAILPSSAVSFNSLTQQISFNIKDEPSPLLAKLTVSDALNAKATTTFPVTADYFPKAKIPIPRQVIKVGEPWSFTLSQNLFSDDDDTAPLVFDVIGMPSWMNRNGTILSGTPTIPSKATLKITATDPKGGIGSTSFDVIVDLFPEVTKKDLFTIIAPIGKAFIYQLPEDTFSYLGSDPLTYTAQVVKSAKLNILQTLQPLPTWLRFESNRKVFTGTPSPTDGGELKVRVTATNTQGASSFADLSIYTAFVPEANVKLPSYTAHKNRLFEAFLPSDSFIDRGGDNVTLSLQAGEKWLSFDNKTARLYGTPNAIGVTNGNIIGKGTLATAQLPFTINTQEDLGLEAADISACNAATGEETRCAIPEGTIKSLDGYPITYTAEMADRSPFPESWLTFNQQTRTLVANPTPYQANPYAIHLFNDNPEIYEVVLTGSDGLAKKTVLAQIKVSGVSYHMMAVEFLSLLITALTTWLALFKWRHSLWRCCFSSHYTLPPVTSRSGEMMDHTIQRSSLGLCLPESKIACLIRPILRMLCCCRDPSNRSCFEARKITHCKIAPKDGSQVPILLQTFFESPEPSTVTFDIPEQALQGMPRRRHAGTYQVQCLDGVPGEPAAFLLAQFDLIIESGGNPQAPEELNISTKDMPPLKSESSVEKGSSIMKV